MVTHTFKHSLLDGGTTQMHFNYVKVCFLTRHVFAEIAQSFLEHFLQMSWSCSLQVTVKKALDRAGQEKNMSTFPYKPVVSCLLHQKHSSICVC